MDSSRKPMILDVGCGCRKRTDAIGIDINPRSSADVFHNLDQLPYPFGNDTFDEIYCRNVLEHLSDVIRVVEELSRIAKNGAMVTIVEPFFGHRNAYTDPTHKHFFGIHSFDYFIAGTPSADYRYSTARLEKHSVVFDAERPSSHRMDRWMARWANAHGDLYENRFAHLYPLRTITYKFRVVKDEETKN